MQINNILLVIYVSVLLFSCSTMTHEDARDNDIIFDSFPEIKIKNNKTTNKKIQLQIRKLETNNIIYFPLDQSYIMPQFFDILNTHANFLNNNKLSKIKIEGHTDERGTPEYNIALGERRAYSVKLYLQSKGVLLDQIVTISYGKEKPVSLEHTEQAYSKNRRAVLLYL